MASTYHAQIQELYVAYFNRPADFLGLDYWEKAIEKAVAAAGSNEAAKAAAIEATLGQISAGFAASDEYNAVYGGKPTEQVIGAVYQNLFGHAPDLPGLIFWVDAVRNGHMTVADAVTTIAAGAQGSDLVTFENKVAAAVAFTNQLDTGDEVLGYNGEKALAAAKSFIGGITTDASLEAALDPVALAASVKAVVDAGLPPVTAVNAQLTKAIDTLAGGAGNDTFTAIDLEWTSLDSVDGGTGTDTFTVAQTAAITTAPAGAVVKNIEEMNLISGGAITVNASSFDTAVLNITAGGASDITASETTDVNELSSTAASSIVGGKNVTIIHSGTGDVYAEGAAGTTDITSTTAGQTVTVVDAQGDVIIAAKGDVVADGVTLNTSVIGAVTRATEVANLNAALFAGFDLSDAEDAADVAAATVTALTTLKADLEAATTFEAAAAITLAAYQAGDLSRADKLAIDAAFKAGLATDADAAQAAAAALVTPMVSAATAASAAADLDVLSFTAANAAAAAVVTKATNASAYDVTATNSTTLESATITGNFSGDVTLSDGSTLKDTLTTVNLDHAGTAVLTGNALSNISMSNTNKGVTVNNSTVGHTINLALSGVTSVTSGVAAAIGSASFTDNVAETINITSNGTATNRLTFTATSATEINISGSAGARLDSLNVDAAAVIDATASSGSNQMTIGGTQSYLGGSGADAITANGTVAQAKVVDGGAGSADKLTVSNATNIADNELTGAVNFHGFETLQVNGIAADVSTFTNSNFTSIVKGSGNVTLSGLTAAQAGAITATASGNLNVGVAGATSIGQLDTVHITTTTAPVDFGTGLVLAGVESLHLTTNRVTGSVTVNGDNFDTAIQSLTGASALTSVKIDGAGDVYLKTGALDVNVNTIIDAGAATGFVLIDADMALTNGLKIIGSATGDNQIWTNNAASVVQVGDGTNQVTSFDGSDTITGGNGDNTIDAGAGNNKVTLGNGFNTVVTLGGNDTITVGTGLNWIDSGNGADKITIAADSTAGVVNYVMVGAAGQANVDTITGLTGADVLQVASFSAGATGADMLATLTHTGTVADLTAVYAALSTQLNGSVGHEFAASVDGADGIVARMVTFTTGAAAGTYLVINDTVANFGAGDVVIKLVGSTGITGDVLVGFDPIP